MIRRTVPIAIACALFCATQPSLFAQGQTPPAGPASPPPTVPANPAPPPAPPGTPQPAPTPGTAPSPAGAGSPTATPAGPPATVPPPSPSWPAAGIGTLPGNRITGIETNRDMISAEAPTEIVINGTAGAKCGVAVDFGDGARSTHSMSETAPFPLRLTHTYPKMADLTIRVTGAASAGLPPCEGMADVAIRVAPAGSKIEYVTLSINSCPEGWSLVGQVSPDKSFRCTPIPDQSAPTNLIHCTDGMKYFARGGNVGCAHPAAAAPIVATAATPPVKDKASGKTPPKGDVAATAAKPSPTGPAKPARRRNPRPPRKRHRRRPAKAASAG